MRRNYLFLGLIGAVTATALIVWRASSSAAPQPADGGQAANERRQANALPLSQVILFNSGVGFFQREGPVEGDARVDLQFPAPDVNDLLKSLVLQDLGHGKITTISYDGQEPIDRTLKTFALDLTGNPTFGQLLNQARGEKVELTLQKDGGLAAGTLTGTIVGMESQQEMAPAVREVHQLNLLCTEGMRCVPLNTVQRVRFLNAALDGEFRRALDVLANAHNGQKKSVTLQFSGEGKRDVKVGYVVEAPMWKSSYRLVFDKAGKATLQGWAIVENTTDEDWKDVRLALVSSRPISFQMNLYQPLFVPRPVVEPERFASLRPPEYDGPLSNSNQLGGFAGAGMMGMGGLGGIAGMGGQGFNQLGAQGGFQGQGNLGVGGGIIGFGGGQGGNLGGQGGFNRYQMGNNLVQAPGVNRLKYEELQKRRQEREKAREQAKKAGSAIAEFDPTDSVNAAALAETIGDQARYTIDHKLNLARQRSALLPLVNQEVSGRRVSIFNEKVNAKFPLRGLKIKNATGQNLMQGPVSVYEGGAYAGDARLPDLQAGEERLLSFAVDQAVEVKAERKSTPDEMTLVRVVKGVVEETHRVRNTTKYLIKNRSGHERTLIVEHPIDPDWKLIGKEKPAERSRDSYRFEWKVPAGEPLAREIVQERTSQEKSVLLSMKGPKIGLLMRSSASSPQLRAALQKGVEYTDRLTETQREVAELQSQYQTVTQEQNRVRTSLDKVPANTPLQKRYLEKLDKQETQIEKLQAQIEEKQRKEKEQKKELEQYLAGLTVE
ncbi:MAG TPA: DUF4139 domain-containing protein [Gemmataceae bacterium]|jgi:hypothetical protein